MTQHDQTALTNVVPAYEVDTLGAPFQVTLVDSVQIKMDEDTGKEMVLIPDFVGMVNAVARCRAIHPRKLSGDEIVFLRKALGIKAKALATYLDISPEHLSRCEAKSKVLSSASERMLRLFVFLATFYESPQDLLAKLEGSVDMAEPTRKAKASSNDLGEAFLQYFLTLKIQTIFAANESLHFRLERTSIRNQPPSASEADDGDWQKAA